MSCRLPLTRSPHQSASALGGHSLDGPIDQIYPARHGKDVADLALIDSSHPNMHKRHRPVDVSAKAPPGTGWR